MKFESNYKLSSRNNIGNVLIGSESFILNDIKGDLLYVTNQKLKDVADNILSINPNKKVLTFPAWDCAPYELSSPKPDFLQQRIKTLVELLLDEKSGGNKVIITSVDAVMQYLPPINIIKSSILNLRKGLHIPRVSLLSYLEETGFNRYSTANENGEYAVRGSIIDIALNNTGWRIDFFGDQIEGIKIFDLETQLTVGEEVEELRLLPSSELILNKKTIECFQRKYVNLFGIQQNSLMNSVSEGNKQPGIEHWLPVFYQDKATIFEYFVSDFTVVANPEILEEDAHNFEEKVKSSFEIRNKYKEQQKNFSDVLPIEELYLNYNQLRNKIENLNSLLFSSYKSPVKNLNAEVAPPFYAFSKLHKISIYQLLKDFIVNSKLGDVQYNIEQFIIACFTEGSRERLNIMLKDHGIHGRVISSWEERLSLKKGVVGLMLFNLERGVIYNGTLISSEQDILGVRQSRVRRREKGNIKYISELQGMSKGDYVVHVEHGIGMFLGINSLEVQNVEHDFIKLKYDNDDKLYVPVENFDLISKYASAESHAILDKLGAASWQRRKASLKQKIKLSADHLVKIAAARKLNKSPILEVIPAFYDEFCSGFPYVETEEQSQAIEDVVEDLRKGIPMDRLICGDVGFGKTEVAMRAAAIAVGSVNKVQVAVIVPTTLLARQHYDNFMQRFKGFDVKIAQLSKFVSRKQSTENKENIKQGDIDIIIGTHALLAKDVQFNNLGLIIVDEEHHFGVSQKEKLKQLQDNVHVLTLSATPIPRTMQFSLSGIRDMSLITTPPVDRLPVNTTVSSFDPVILRDAIMREHQRGGRVFYVTPRVQYIDEIKLRLEKLVPEVKIVTAHGKMKGNELDKIMNDFYDGKFDVLLSTTIVESGLDINVANTMIIDRAEMFGLAQLYQIRGRVGRSKTRAYAYLITESPYLSQSARRRLEVMQSLNYAGSGMMIATHDMDIRGYGNLLGEEQSGHIKEVGMELYQSMLEQAIEAISHNKHEDNWSPIINIGLPVSLPNDYIGDESLKLSTYKQLSNINDHDEIESFATSLIDRFGPLPEESKYLIEVLKIKLKAKDKGISKLDLGAKGVLLTFYNQQPLSHDKIICLVNKDQSVKLRPDGKLFVKRTWQSNESKIKGLHNIIDSL